MRDPVITKIAESGIVGAGGAGFPTHVKVNAKAAYVIVNGAECEPLLRVDQQLMEQKHRELFTALQEVLEVTGARKGIIALKKKYQGAIKALENSPARNKENMELFLLEDFYPAGDEQITVQEVLRRIVPEGGIPLQVQTVVINVETLFNIEGALRGNPVTEKYLTVAGAVKHPVTLRVPLGISVGEAIELAGGSIVPDFALVDGGPMMGKLLPGTDVPVTKTTKGILVLPREHPLIQGKLRSLQTMVRQARAACCHCSLCTEVCPRHLLGHRLHPDKIMRLASYGIGEKMEHGMTEAFLCCECGLCEQACVMGLQPWKLNQFLKSQMLQAGMKNPHRTAPAHPHEFRAYRKFPVKKLVGKLGLEAYNVAAPLVENTGKTFSHVILPLQQHIGARAVPLVQAGMVVKRGQVVADVAENQLGAKIHASIDGVVKSVQEDRIEIQRQS